MKRSQAEAVSTEVPTTTTAPPTKIQRRHETTEIKSFASLSSFLDEATLEECKYIIAQLAAEKPLSFFPKLNRVISKMPFHQHDLEAGTNPKVSKDDVNLEPAVEQAKTPDYDLWGEKAEYRRNTEPVGAEIKRWLDTAEAFVEDGDTDSYLAILEGLAEEIGRYIDDITDDEIDSAAGCKDEIKRLVDLWKDELPTLSAEKLRQLVENPPWKEVGTHFHFQSVTAEAQQFLNTK